VNAEKIRAEAIERVARTEWNASYAPPWDQLPEELQARHRRSVAPYVDALGDMLPVDIEVRRISRGKRLRRRYVGEWREDPR